MKNEIPVFVYGMLLDPFFVQRVQGEIVGPAKLPGYELLFDQFATVRVHSGEIVYGAILNVDSDGLRHMDRIEGVYGDPRDGSTGLYRRAAAVVELIELGRSVMAEVYIKNRINLDNPFAPSPHYLDVMMRGYKHHGLPLEYLERVLSAHTFASEDEFNGVADGSRSA